MKQKHLRIIAVAVFIVILTISSIWGATATELPYVQDGLEACYLGNNNTGSGQDTEATTWADLSGKGNDIINVLKDDNNYFTDNAYLLDTSKTYFPQAVVDVVNGQEFTVELVLGELKSLGQQYNTFINSNNDYFALFRRLSDDYIEFKNYTNSRPQSAGGLDYFTNSTVTITFKVGGKVTMYVDGVQIDQKDAVNPIGADDLWFGHDHETRNYEAEFLSMRFYSVELTAAQVEANYLGDLEIFYGDDDSSDDTSDDESEESEESEESDESEEESSEPSAESSEDESSETSAPQTGDESRYILYAVIAIAAVLIIATSLITGRRKA